MNSAFGGQHVAVRNTVQTTACREVALVCQEWTRNQERAPRILPKMVKLSLLGLRISARCGGMGVARGRQNADTWRV
jgi:hypothetical protein